MSPWTNRRVEIELLSTVGNIARHTLPFFKTRCIQVPAYAEAQRREAEGRLRWLDAELADGRPFVAGKRFSMADITGMTATMLVEMLQVEVPEELAHFRRWDASLRTRPSWGA